jgi:phosphatidylethanolamine/phosphatidyl-N-methylethanolamine N-methyltransferase
MAITTEPSTLGHLRERAHFLRGLLASPRNVASLFPSSRALAGKIAAQVDPDGLVLELGPGTGAVTAALLARGIPADRLLLVEYDAEFVGLLRSRFAGVRVRQGNALDLDAALMDAPWKLTSVVSGLPLLNFPTAVRKRLLERALSRLEPGRPFIQLSFGVKPPITAEGNWTLRRAGRIYRNIPPATVWVYNRP